MHITPANWNQFVCFEFLQVIVVSIKNRKLALPENPVDLYEINEKETISREEQIAHTKQFR
jgi:peptide/histidine transporter 3/4